MADISKEITEIYPPMKELNDGHSVPELVVSEDNKVTTTESNAGGENGHEQSESSAFKFSKFSRRQKFVLVLCTTALFWASCAFAILGPFYPIEAAKKGMSTVLIGFVFGVFEVVIFISSPFFGNYLTKLGPKCVYIAGIFVGGASNILFGTLGELPDGTPFIVASIVCRCIQALGFSGFITASFAIVSNEFKDNVGMTLGIMESGSGLGFMLGPVLGGLLYELGGYGFPFYFVGAMVLLNGAVVFKFLPNPDSTPSKRTASIFYLLRSPLVVISLCCAFAGVTGISTYDATFARRLEPFGMSTLLNSVVFAVVAILYIPTSMIYGFITDKKDIQAPLIVGGIIIFGIGFLILGPSVLLPFLPSNLWTVGISLLLMGSTFGCALIPTLKSMVNGAIYQLHFEDNIDTYALVSGLFNSVYCLGGFVGPVGVGAIIEAFGYPVAYTAVGLLCIFMGGIALLFFSLQHANRKRYDLGDTSKNSLDNNVTILFKKSVTSSK